MTDLAIQDNDKLLASKQLNLVYQRYPLSFASSLLLSGALVAALWPIAAPQTLLAWMLSLWLVMGVRSFYSRRYLRMGQSGAGEHGKWRAGLVAGSVVAGVCWGVTVFLFLASPHDEAAVLVMFIIAG
ncbi:MAG TPA: hypothetical protein VFW53_10225, partial [Gallionella sp.]|nr:hypothetical protein [Gallionella sp.]